MEPTHEDTKHRILNPWVFVVGLEAHRGGLPRWLRYFASYTASPAFIHALELQRRYSDTR